MSENPPETKPIVPSDTFSLGDECSDVPQPTDRDVPYIPTDEYIVNKMLEMAKVGKGDLLYDLGCGDGRICITAARLGARAIGVEIDLALLRKCHENLRNTALRDRVTFRRQSFFDTDLRDATVVALYLLPAFNRRLRPKLLWELKPGSRVIANYFEIADWQPDEKVVVKHRPLMLWIVPAWLGGQYKCTLTGLAGAAPRQHAFLSLQRNFQFLTGQLTIGKQKHLLAEGRIRGNDASFTAGPYIVQATYSEGVLRGHWRERHTAGVFIGQRLTAELHPPGSTT